MDYILSFVALVALSGCGETSVPPPRTQIVDNMPSVESSKLDKASRNLLFHQEKNFDRILEELSEHNKKVSHWIWWVFPTELPGNSEPSPKSSVSSGQAEIILAKAKLREWTRILETIAMLLETHPLASNPKRPNTSIIPSIDHGRIAYSLDFWLRKVGEQTKKHEEFYQALKVLDTFQWR